METRAKWQICPTKLQDASARIRIHPKKQGIAHHLQQAGFHGIDKLWLHLESISYHKRYRLNTRMAVFSLRCAIARQRKSSGKKGKSYIQLKQLVCSAPLISSIEDLCKCRWDVNQLLLLYPSPASSSDILKVRYNSDVARAIISSTNWLPCRYRVEPSPRELRRPDVESGECRVLQEFRQISRALS